MRPIEFKLNEVVAIRVERVVYPNTFQLETRGNDGLWHWLALAEFCPDRKAFVHYNGTYQHDTETMLSLAAKHIIKSTRT